MILIITRPILHTVLLGVKHYFFKYINFVYFYMFKNSFTALTLSGLSRRVEGCKIIQRIINSSRRLNSFIKSRFYKFEF